MSTKPYGIDWVLTSADDTSISAVGTAADEVEEGKGFHGRTIDKSCLTARAVYPSELDGIRPLTEGCVTHCNGSYLGMMS